MFLLCVPPIVPGTLATLDAPIPVAVSFVLLNLSLNFALSALTGGSFANILSTALGSVPELLLTLLANFSFCFNKFFIA